MNSYKIFSLLFYFQICVVFIKIVYVVNNTFDYSLLIQYYYLYSENYSWNKQYVYNLK